MKGNIEARGVFLENAVVNTANMIATLQLQGTLGHFYLDTRAINLSEQLVDLETVALKDASIFLTMKDTLVVSQDTVETPANWKVILPHLEVKNVAFAMDMPADTMNVAAYIGNGQIKDVLADLGNQLYSVQKISFDNTGVDYPNIAVRGARMEIDSVYYQGSNMRAVIQNLAFEEQYSGLSITAMFARAYMDPGGLMVPAFKLQTPHSEINFRVQTAWNPQTPFDISRLEARLDARLGKQDVLLFAGDASEALRRDYPAMPMVVQIGAEGDMDNIQISRLSADLPGAFSLKGEGRVLHVADSVKRAADISLQMQTRKLDFIFGLANVPQDGSILIPPLAIDAGVKMEGPRIAANLLAQESTGTVRLNADYNLNTAAYRADLAIDSLQVNHFMPKDSIYGVSVAANVAGRGTDFASAQTTATAKATVNGLQYGRYNISGIDLTAGLKNALATARVTSNNALLVMDASGAYKINSPHMDAEASVNIADVNIYELGLIDKPMTGTLSLTMVARVREDSVQLSLVSGDLEARLRARGPLQPLIDQSMGFTNVLMRQIDARKLDHKELRASLPTVRLNMHVGQNNPVRRFFMPDNINFDTMNAGFVVNPQRGINGGAFVRGLQVDTLQLDTVYLAAFQDTTRLNLRAGVVNGPKNPQHVFHAAVTGEIRTNDGEILLEFKNDKEETGILLGANVRPESNGFNIRLIPENPIVAFRNFSFNHHDKVFIHNSGRVQADVRLFNEEGMGIGVRSMPDSTTYLQNLDIEIRRIELADISNLLPYYPRFSGIFSAEAIFQQTKENIQLSTEVHIGDLFYENERAGNIGVGATWLPGNNDTHYIDTYVTLEGKQILTAGGRYQGGARDDLNIKANLEHIPLYFANLFVDRQLIELTGDLDGNLSVEGSTSRPRINGELMLDSVRLYSTQYSLSFALDERPLQITNSRLTFDKFGIYTSGNNPFTVDGYVDFANLSNAMANLTLVANNFELLNTPRRGGRMLYGKAYFDLNSTIKGPLDQLVMRGDLNLLGTTKMNYVLTESALTVQDRLGSLVEFTSFAGDTIPTPEEEPTLALGGIDIALNINIDQATAIGVDLDPDRSNYVDIIGGGTLNFQYTPQGDMVLIGRYTLTGGTLKYSLPIIPLKEFSIDEGSYVEWVSDPMNPNLNFKATERMRVAVSNQDAENTSRSVVFDASIGIQNTLENLELVFDLTAPDDPDIRAELDAMAPEERSKQAVAMMATGQYLARGSTGSGFNFENALNNFFQNQLAGIAGSAFKHANITLDMESYDDTGGTRTDYNFKYAQRLFNDRVQVVIGGKISTGAKVEESESFIDNISLEYRLDPSGTRYVRLYHDRNYENVFEGEIVETGVGLVLRKKVNKLGELFIFRKRKGN